MLNIGIIKPIFMYYMFFIYKVILAKIGIPAMPLILGLSVQFLAIVPPL